MVGMSFVDIGKAFSFGGVGGRTAEVDMVVLIWARKGGFRLEYIRLSLFGFPGVSDV